MIVEARHLAIPTRRNLLLVVLVTTTMAALLFLASRVEGWWLALVAVAFAMIALTNYALMHEASHRTLHPWPWLNDALGAITGMFFPTSATLMRVTHEVHHRCNRTDHEMFDVYYQGDHLLLKRAQWYSILTGLFYLVIPLGAFFVGFARPLLLTRPFKHSRSSGVLFDDFDAGTLWRVRSEALLLVVVWGTLLGSGVLHWLPTLILFAAAGINWSSRQYVTHAWSPRRIADGAHNLATSRLHQALLLNGNWDVVHHLAPAVPWIHLPELGRQSRPPIPYLGQWLSLWRGPRLATEPGPVLPERPQPAVLAV